MTRLNSRIVWDLRLQVRNGFYYAAGVVALIFVIVLAWLPQDSLSWVMPVALFGNLVTNGFYFIGGLVLLEKAEGSLEAQVVTPLRSWEYLAAKAATLCLLSLVESLLIVAIAYRGDIDLWPLAAGIVLLTALLCFFGFLVVARYDSINEYLFPSFLITTLLALPMIDYFELWRHWLFYLHPVQAPLLLIRAGFRALSPGELFYALVYGALWVLIAGGLCLRSFRRFVVMKQRVQT